MEIDPSTEPLPTPKFSFHRRVLDTNLLTPLSTCPQGRRYLLEALQQHTAAAYWQLSEHMVHQSDPAYCGITTLLVVLNSMGMDPNVRWRGGWRYFGNEDTLLQQCCLSSSRIQRVGIHLEEFAQLATCQGLQVQLKRPSSSQHTLQNFRDDVQRLLTESNVYDDTRNNNNLPDDANVNHCRKNDKDNHNDDHRFQHAASVMVVSFSRSVLGQTGEGHFSPLAAYHAATDQVLVLDVARFKYAPYWVPLELLYQAMIPVDVTTTPIPKSRGWFLLHPPSLPLSSSSSSSNNNNCGTTIYRGRNITDEASRPAHLVPKVFIHTSPSLSSSSSSSVTEQPHFQKQQGTCPVHPIKIEYCKIREPK